MTVGEVLITGIGIGLGIPCISLWLLMGILP